MKFNKNIKYQILIVLFITDEKKDPSRLINRFIEKVCAEPITNYQLNFMLPAE